VYPGLAAAARDHLAARMTSADSERTFSSGKHMISDYSNWLGEETIKKCMLMKSWMLFLDKK